MKLQGKSEEFDRFESFMRKLVAVPHDKIKAKLDAEKQERTAKRASSSGHVSRAKKHSLVLAVCPTLPVTS